MGKAKVNTTEREVRFARAFIAAIHGNSNNGYLILAIIAWIRAEGGRWRGGNPLGLTINGVRQTYTSWAAGARAVAAYLMRREAYRILIRRARQMAVGDEELFKQGRDFLTILAQSPYDENYYGSRSRKAKPRRPGITRPQYYWTAYDETKNELLLNWGELLGHPVPPEWFVDVIQPAKPPKEIPAPFQQDRTIVNRFPRNEYIQPYEAAGFYRARPHLGEFILNADGLVE